MKVYLFYLKYENSIDMDSSYYILSARDLIQRCAVDGYKITFDEYSLLLYGYTNSNKDRKEFQKLRNDKIFFMKVIDIDRGEYGQLTRDYPEGQLSHEAFVYKKGKEITLLVTEYEWTTSDSEYSGYQIICNSDVMNCIDAIFPRGINTQLFSESFYQLLTVLGFSHFFSGYPLDDDINISPNEFSVFIDMYGNTFRGGSRE